MQKKGLSHPRLFNGFFRLPEFTAGYKKAGRNSKAHARHARNRESAAGRLLRGRKTGCSAVSAVSRKKRHTSHWSDTCRYDRVSFGGIAPDAFFAKYYARRVLPPLRMPRLAERTNSTNSLTSGIWGRVVSISSSAFFMLRPRRKAMSYILWMVRMSSLE